MAKVFGIVGHSNSGKTTLIERLIPLFIGRGMRVSVIKHTHHSFDVDHPGKDSWRHREAGASEVLLACEHRWALLHELRGAPEPTLYAQLRGLSPCDLVLVEGFKSTPIPKLEVYREPTDRPALWPQDPAILAVAVEDVAGLSACPRVVLPYDATDAIAEFILAHSPEIIPGDETATNP